MGPVWFTYFGPAPGWVIVIEEVVVTLVLALIPILIVAYVVRDRTNRRIANAPVEMEMDGSGAIYDAQDQLRRSLAAGQIDAAEYHRQMEQMRRNDP